MKGAAATLAAVVSGALGGALLGALLLSSSAALSPEAGRGCALVWLSGAGLGILLTSVRGWRERWLLAAISLGLGVSIALVAAPWAAVALGLEGEGLVQGITGWFWETGGPDRGLEWRFLMGGAGVLAGLGAPRRWALASAAFAGGVLLARWVGERAGAGTLGLVLGASLASGAWAASVSVLGRFGRGSMRVEELDPEALDFGPVADDPPVLRPRLAGIMMLTMLFAAVLFACVAIDLDGLLAAGCGRLDLLAACALSLAVGLVGGRGLLVVSRHLVRAELAPLFLLLGGALAMQLTPSLQGALSELARPPRDAPPWLARFAGQLLAVGPTGLVAGAALQTLPRLAFSPAPLPRGARPRSDRLVALTLMPLGLLAHPAALGLVFVAPGPALVLAGLLGLAATGLFLVVDLRGQSVSVVKGRVAALVPVLVRAAAGLLLASLALGLLSSGTREGLPAQLVRVLSTGTPDGARLGLGDRETWRYAPWLETTDWVRGVRLEREGEVELADSATLAGVRRAATRLARVLGCDGPPSLVDSRTSPLASSGWILDRSAGGADQRRAFSGAALARLNQRANGERPVIAWLPTELNEEAFDRALRSFGTHFASASVWLVEGVVLLVGSADLPRLDLAEGRAARRVVAGYLRVLEGTGGELDGDWQLVGRGLGEPPTRLQRLRQKARNLERLAAGRGALPAEWGALLGDFPEVQLGRALIELRLAAAWIDYDRQAAPGSLALESWQARLERARLDAALLAPEDPELLALDARLRGEAELAAGQGALRTRDPHAAVEHLLRARESLGRRGDVEIALAAAFELSGNQGAAVLTWSGLEERGPALLRGEAAWLAELGFAPPAE